MDQLRSHIKLSKVCFLRYSCIQTPRSLFKINSAAPRFFNLLLSVWISDETRFLLFDIHVLRKHKLIELEVLLGHTVLIS